VTQRDIVLDHRGLADDEAGRVVEEDTLPDPGGRVDVGLEDLGGAALQIESQVAPVPAPEPVRQPVGLQGVEALEVEHRLEQPVAGRIAVEHRDHVGTEAEPDRRIVGDGRVEGLDDQLGRQCGMGQAAGDAMGDRLLEAALVQHIGEDEAGQRRLGGDRRLGLAAQARPDRVDPVQARGEVADLGIAAAGGHDILHGKADGARESRPHRGQVAMPSS
jgi:hypothetical protein